VEITKQCQRVSNYKVSKYQPDTPLQLLVFVQPAES